MGCSVLKTVSLFEDSLDGEPISCSFRFSFFMFIFSYFQKCECYARESTDSKICQLLVNVHVNVEILGVLATICIQKHDAIQTRKTVE
mgnify:CR=1 FL=1